MAIRNIIEKAEQEYPPSLKQEADPIAGADLNILSGYINSTASNIVFTTGNQTISGEKTFVSRPTVNGTGVLLSGEAAQLPETIVYTTGDQTISGEKTFSASLFVFSGANVVFVDNTGIVSGQWQFANRPTVNGTGVLLSGDSIIQYTFTEVTGENVLYTTGDQTISGKKEFASNTTRFGEGPLRIYFSDNTFGNELGFITSDDDVLAVRMTDGKFEYGGGTPGGASLSILNNIANFINRPTVNGTGLLLSGEAAQLPETIVYITGDQTISGIKNFVDNVYIKNLFVTGTETIVNTTNFNVQSPYLLLNLTGGAVDGGIFFVTGSGLTGINDTGPIIGFDHSNKFKFGVSTRGSDLTSLPDIASVQQINSLSGYVDSNFVTSFVIQASTSQSNLPNANTVYFFMGHSAGYSASRTDRPTPFLEDCTVRKVSITLQQAGASITGFNITGYIINTTKNLTGIVFTAANTTADSNFYHYTNNNLNIPFSVGDSGACAIFSTTAGVTSLRAMANIYCYS